MTKSISADPDTLDQENLDLRKRITLFYEAIALAECLVLYDAPAVFLTGANTGSETDVRQYSRYPQLYYNPGGFLPRINEEWLADAVAIAATVPGIYGTRDFGRIRRAHHAFRAALKEHDVDERLHQFVRCVEGFLKPEQGKATRRFKSRTELFLGPRHHEVAEDMYELRSAVEHLNDPLEDIPEADRRERRLTIMRRSWEAEALARYCLKTFFLTPPLLEHFRIDNTISAFWDMNAHDRAALWGPAVDMNAISAAFRPRVFKDDELGL